MFNLSNSFIEYMIDEIQKYCVWQLYDVVRSEEENVLGWKEIGNRRDIVSYTGLFIVKSDTVL